jgi:transglutaminase-like putative cysteine protease
MKVAHTRIFDLTASALLFVLILTAVGRLGVTKWVPDLDRVQTLAIIAVLLGLAFGWSKFRRRVVAGLSLGYTLTVIPLQLARIMDTEAGLDTRLLSLGGRLSFALTDFFQDKPVQDPIFFLTLLALVFWIIGFTAGYFLVWKNSYLAAVLPAGLLMLVIQTYDYYPAGRVWFLAFYIFVALVLLSRMNYLRNQEAWRQRRVFVVPESSLDLINGAAIAAGIIILIAWMIPGVSNSVVAARAWERLTEPWRVMRENLSDAFAAVQGGAGVGTEFFGEQMALGTGAPLSDETMFRVHMSDSRSGTPRFYWRGRVYDRYEDRRWVSTADAARPYSPSDGDLPLPDLNSRRLQDFTFTVFNSQATLYLPSQPLWVDRKASLRPIFLPDSKLEAAFLRTPDKMQAGDVYRARAAIATPTIAEMRAAGEQYPDWVLERYLQLPEGFSPKIQALAREITEKAQTPYDKVAAITNYLRREIEYTPTIPPPRSGQDPLEYFLLDIKRGFCNYYASAEVLMLRSVGVPARMAVGFAEGKPDLSGNNFTVVQRDAHAWPEVYFQGIGWVEFEPTGNQEALTRPPGVERTDDGGFQNPLSRLTEDGDERFPGGGRPEQQDVEAGVADISSPTLPLFLSRGLFLALALLLLGLLWYLNWRHAFLKQIPGRLVYTLEKRQASVPAWLRNWDLYIRSGPLGRAFETVNTSLRWLGETPPIHATPAQRARVLTDLMPEAAECIQCLLLEHQADLYSPYPGDIRRARHAGLDLWRHALRAILRRWYTSILERF